MLRGEHAGHVREEPVHVARARGSARRSRRASRARPCHERCSGPKLEQHARVARDLRGACGREVAARHRVEEALRSSPRRCPCPRSSVAAPPRGASRRASRSGPIATLRVVVSGLEQLGGALEELAQQLPLPLGPGRASTRRACRRRSAGRGCAGSCGRRPACANSTDQLRIGEVAALREVRHHQVLLDQEHARARVAPARGRGARGRRARARAPFAEWSPPKPLPMSWNRQPRKSTRPILDVAHQRGQLGQLLGSYLPRQSRRSSSTRKIECTSTV